MERERLVRPAATFRRPPIGDHHPDRVALVGAVTVADRLMGPSVALPILYVIPIGLVAWLGRVGAGVIRGAASAGAALWVDEAIHRGSAAVITVNALARVSIYLLIATLLSSLKAAWRREHAASRRDPLTGIANRREFFELAEREIARARRSRAQITVLYLDIDDFKQVNDAAGHAAGDEVLRCLASTLDLSTRANDLVARLGGDEFVVLAPDQTEGSAGELIERLRGVVASAFAGRGWPVTVTIGAVTFVEPPESVDALLTETDHVMYSAKREGKGASLLGRTPEVRTHDSLAIRRCYWSITS